MSIEKYLNGQRTQELWTKIKTALSGKQDRLIPDETVLIKDGGISVKTPVKPLTKAAYDGLSEEEKQAEAVYLVDEPPWTPVPLSIQEYDTEDGWHVRRWSDGYVEMILETTTNPSNWLLLTTNIRYDTLTSINLPFSLVKRYKTDANAFDNSNGYQSVAVFQKLNSNHLLSSTGDFWMLAFTNAPPKSVGVTIEITGRWK